MDRLVIAVFVEIDRIVAAESEALVHIAAADRDLIEALVRQIISGGAEDEVVFENGDASCADNALGALKAELRLFVVSAVEKRGRDGTLGVVRLKLGRADFNRILVETEARRHRPVRVELHIGAGDVVGPIRIEAGIDAGSREIRLGERVLAEQVV
jgi:hypothetical protein